MNFVKETKTRLKLELPDYFKKIRNVAATLTVIAVAILGLQSTIPNFVLPEKLINILSYIAAAGTAIAATAQTAAKPDVPNHELDES